MKGIIICMTCLLAVALTVGGPIRRQASQSEKTVTVPIGGTATLLCPLVPNDIWKWVYWKKNNRTIYSLEVKSNTTTTNDTRYEGRNHDTRFTIKDLKKTDSGIYHCKVATLLSVYERGHVLLHVTDQDQEVGLSTTSPGVSLRASTTLPPQPAEDKPIFLIFLIFIPIITVCLVYKYWERIKSLPAGFVSAFRRLASTITFTPLAPDSSNRETRDEGAPICDQPTNRGGTKPCHEPGCKTCTLVTDLPTVTGLNGNTVVVEGNFTCRSNYVIYYIRCDRCQKAYFGKTKKILNVKMNKHRRDILNMQSISSKITKHFTLPRHTIKDFKVCVIRSFPVGTSDEVMQVEVNRLKLLLGTIEPDSMNKG